jgi:hypothetical protein
MDALKTPRPKKPYSSPKLAVHGPIEKLTEANGLHGAKDGGKAPHIRTHF